MTTAELVTRDNNTTARAIEQDVIQGDLSALTPEQIDSMWKRIGARLVDNIATGCWEWQGARTTAGYGLIKVPGWRVPQYTHRLAYLSQTGEVPDSIDHLCKNHTCCNPSHLESVTPAVNTLRGDGMSSRHQRATHCQRGHVKTTENTYVYPDGHTECRPCRSFRWQRFAAKRGKKS